MGSRDDFRHSAGTVPAPMEANHCCGNCAVFAPEPLRQDVAATPAPAKVAHVDASVCLLRAQRSPTLYIQGYGANDKRISFREKRYEFTGFQMFKDATSRIGLHAPTRLLATWLRALRRGEGRSQFDAAVAYSTNLRTLQTWESGYSLPDFAHTVSMLLREVTLVANQTPLEMQKPLIGRLLLATCESREEMLYVLGRYGTLAANVTPNSETSVGGTAEKGEGAA